MRVEKSWEWPAKKHYGYALTVDLLEYALISEALEYYHDRAPNDNRGKAAYDIFATMEDAK